MMTILILLYPLNIKLFLRIFMMLCYDHVSKSREFVLSEAVVPSRFNFFTWTHAASTCTGTLRPHDVFDRQSKRFKVYFAFQILLLKTIWTLKSTIEAKCEQKSREHVCEIEAVGPSLNSILKWIEMKHFVCSHYFHKTNWFLKCMLQNTCICTKSKPMQTGICVPINIHFTYKV